MMYHLNDTDDHDPESLSTWMKVILPGSKEKNLAEAAISAAGDLYFDEDAHGLLRYFDIKDDSTQSGNQLDAFKS